MEPAVSRASMGNIVKEVTPVIDTAIYAAGDRLGSVMEIGGALGSPSGCTILESLTIVDKAKQSLAIDVYFFSDTPTVASADNAPIDISGSEMALKYLGHVSVVAGDYQALASCSAACIRNQKLALKGNGASQSIYALAIARGTPTYGNASALTFKFGLS